MKDEYTIKVSANDLIILHYALWHIADKKNCPSMSEKAIALQQVVKEKIKEHDEKMKLIPENGDVK